MSLNDAPSANRIHRLFRQAQRRKIESGQRRDRRTSPWSPTAPGTTTDPVQKAMELLPLGPVVMTGAGL